MLPSVQRDRLRRLVQPVALASRQFRRGRGIQRHLRDGILPPALPGPRGRGQGRALRRPLRPVQPLDRHARLRPVERLHSRQQRGKDGRTGGLRVQPAAGGHRWAVGAVGGRVGHHAGRGRRISARRLSISERRIRAVRSR